MNWKAPAVAALILAAAVCAWVLLRNDETPLAGGPPAVRGRESPKPAGPEPLASPEVAQEERPVDRQEDTAGIIRGYVQRADTGEAVTDFSLAVLAEVPLNPARWRGILKDEAVSWERCRSADGSFVLEDAADGIRAVAVRAEGFEPAYEPVGKPELRVRLTPETGIAGRVESERGEPVSGAAIWLGEGRKSEIVARSDAAGRFHIGGIEEGEAAITAEHGDFMPATVRVNVWRGRVSEARIVMKGGGTIEGFIDKDGRPAAHVAVMVYDEGNFRKRVKTGGAGRYSVKGVPPGEVTVECQTQIEGTGTPLGRLRGAFVEAGRTTVVDISLPNASASLGGSVIVGNAPATGGRVKLTVLSGGGYVYMNTGISEDGAYRFENVPGGEAWLTVRAEAGNLERMRQLDLTIGAGEEVRQDIELGGSGVIEGRIENPSVEMAYHVDLFAEWRPAAAAQAEPDAAEMAVAKTVADMAGKFRMEGIEPGAYVVQAMAVSVYAGDSPEEYAKSSALTQEIAVEEGKTAAVVFRF